MVDNQEYVTQQTNDFLDCFYGIKKRIEIPAFLKKFSLNNIIAEIGVNQGVNFRCLLGAGPKQVYGVDKWQAKDWQIWKKEYLTVRYNDMKKLEASDSRVKIIKDFSLNAVKNFEDDFFDYVYIDADHHYEAVSQDIEQWYKKVKIGGIFAGHDYIKKRWSGVIKAIGEFREKNSKLPFHLTKEECATWLFVKQ